jgi:wyosine [tRNA(Phe)-imidazoG37] synthetase (radical SAM superfamily)
MIVSGLKDLRKRYNGLIFLEVILLAGVNDSEQEVEGLRRAINEISPEKVQLNTVIRPPSDPRAKPMEPGQMEKIRRFIGNKAEIIGYMPLKKKSIGHDSARLSVIEMARRRPVRLIDIAEALNKTKQETEHLIKGMLVKGEISEKKYGEELFYLVRQD